MAPQRITPKDAARIIEDLESLVTQDRQLRWKPYECKHREEIIEKLRPIAQQVVTP